ncbi:MAG: MalY/PatB family protein [Eubacteriales bacterium]|nr:MalY/PatB family protein [Eubacteriales bacterium]
MQYDFDKVVDRRGTGSLKYDFAKRYQMPEDLLPLWVADMDFTVAEPITKALQAVVDHGIYGYSEVDESYAEVVCHWYSSRFGWEASPRWLVKTPGIVFAIAMAVRAFTEVGDGVLIQEPVYYPFRSTIEANQREVIVNELVLRDGRYEMNFEQLEELLASGRVKLLLLCSPHNPVSRVWTIEELQRLGELCLRYKVPVLSDEIHSDFVLGDQPHYVLTKAVPALHNQAIICTAPSKTFNLAGLQVSNIFIADQQLRRRFRQEMHAAGYSQLNTLGLAAAKAAYSEGQEWLEQLLEYLKGNIEFVRSFLVQRLPQAKLIEPQGTYLLWLDLRAYGDSDTVDRHIVQEAKLWLDRGEMFGACGAGFQRINVACPRSILAEAMERISTLASRGK